MSAFTYTYTYICMHVHVGACIVTRGVARRKIRGFLKAMTMCTWCTKIVVSWTHCTIINSLYLL